MFPRGDEHWILPQIAEAADCRVVINGRLANGMRMKLVWADYISRLIREEGFYELETVKFLQSLLRPGARFFDVGAHLGQYTLLGAAREAEVHAFEPDANTFSLLIDNVRANKLNGVFTNSFAIQDRCGTTRFYPGSPANIGGAACTPHSRNPDKWYDVECHTLDCYVEKHGIPDLVKMDIEGRELEALRGATQILRHGVPLVLEFNPRLRDCEALACLLRQNGYELARITAAGLVPYVPMPAERNFLNVFAKFTHRRH